MYAISTGVPLAGGLRGPYLHLHADDDQQSLLAQASAWHCETPGDGTSSMHRGCFYWTCTSTGDYLVRVQAFSGGTGGFTVRVDFHGSVDDVAAAEGLAPVLRPLADKVHYTFDSLGITPGTWTTDIRVSCQLAYCAFHRDNQPQQLTSDGQHIYVPLRGYVGATYTFAFELPATENTAVYVKLVVYPKNSTAGAAAFDQHPEMSHTVKLGTWSGSAGPGHHDYASLNSDYDLGAYQDFPGEVYNRTGHFEWVAPTDDDYFVQITSVSAGHPRSYLWCNSSAIFSHTQRNDCLFLATCLTRC